ncbi:MAG: DUF2726 domain-containing protein [Novosphingobium sp.]|nr:DUF2726 domain-containing protein [Novosphingobium sp.]
MPPEIIALIDKPLLLALVLAVGALSGMAVERIAERMNKAERQARWQARQGGGNGRRQTRFGFRKQRAPTAPKAVESRGTVDAAEQLRRVMEADFKPRPLLNRSERRLLSIVDQALAAECPGWRAMGQVSLGEVLASDDKDAYFAINSKRVDLLIVDEDSRPLHAIEFQGTGHHLSNTTAARDAIKKEALRRAGIGYFEVVSGDTPAMVREKLRRLAGQRETPPRQSPSTRTPTKSALNPDQRSIRDWLGV